MDAASPTAGLVEPPVASPQPQRGPAPEADFAALSEAAGSTITITTPRGEPRDLRRVVQLVDTRETQSFPRTFPSEQGKRSAQDVLRRGDALLYALGKDAFRPGDAVRWQDRDWEVIGSLGVEMVGDARLYQEVGLRRLPLRALARAEGAIVLPHDAGSTAQAGPEPGEQEGEPPMAKETQELETARIGRTVVGSVSPQRADVDGAHELRLDRIEESLQTLHKKIDRLVEDAAIARTEIAWLKWGTRLLFAGVLGVGGLTVGQFVGV
jgi:hypothetical protein